MKSYVAIRKNCLVVTNLSETKKNFKTGEKFVDKVIEKGVIEVLKTINSGIDGQNIYNKGWIENILVRDGHVVVVMEVPQELGKTLESARINAEKAIFDIKGVISANVALTSKKQKNHDSKHSNPEQSSEKNLLNLPNIKKIIAISS